jgi:hypothetical protein
MEVVAGTPPSLPSTASTRAETEAVPVTVVGDWGLSPLEGPQRQRKKVTRLKWRLVLARDKRGGNAAVQDDGGEGDGGDGGDDDGDARDGAYQVFAHVCVCGRQVCVCGRRVCVDTRARVCVFRT